MKPKSIKQNKLESETTDSTTEKHYLPVKQYPDIIEGIIGNKRAESDEPKSNWQPEQIISVEDLFMI